MHHCRLLGNQESSSNDPGKVRSKFASGYRSAWKMVARCTPSRVPWLSIVYPFCPYGKELCFKAHISKQSGISARVSEWVKVPANFRGDTELRLQEAVSNHHVVDHVFIVGTWFISRGPSTVGEFQSTLFDEHLNILLHLFGLATIPHFEVLHLNIGEFSSRILQKLIDSIIKDQTDICVLSILICSWVILIGFDPAYLVMSMRNEMDINSLVILIRSWYDLDRRLHFPGLITMGPTDLFNLQQFGS